VLKCGKPSEVKKDIPIFKEAMAFVGGAEFMGCRTRTADRLQGERLKQTPLEDGRLRPPTPSQSGGGTGSSYRSSQDHVKLYSSSEFQELYRTAGLVYLGTKRSAYPLIPVKIHSAEKQD
jgi:hypothetical protein